VCIKQFLPAAVVSNPQQIEYTMESPSQTIDNSDLKDNDILLGRGTGPNEHNKSFRSLVATNKGKYKAAKTRKDRAAVIQETVLLIQKGKGRFLKKLKMKGGKHRFVVVNEMNVIKAKMKQAFRYSLEGTGGVALAGSVNANSATNTSNIKHESAKKEQDNVANGPFPAARVTPPSLALFDPISSVTAIQQAQLADGVAGSASFPLAGARLTSGSMDSAMVLLLEQALAERAQNERYNALLGMQLRQQSLLRSRQQQESTNLGFLLRSAPFSTVAGLDQASLMSTMFPTSAGAGTGASAAGLLRRANRDFDYTRMHLPACYLQPDFL
jgi:hypothetical protein